MIFYCSSIFEYYLTTTTIPEDILIFFHLFDKLFFKRVFNDVIAFHVICASAR